MATQELQEGKEAFLFELHYNRVLDTRYALPTGSVCFTRLCLSILTYIITVLIEGTGAGLV